MDPKYLAPSPAEVSLRAAEAFTRVKQQEHEAAYQKAVVAVTNQLREMEGNNMSNTLKSQVRQWFFDSRRVCSHLLNLVQESATFNPKRTIWTKFLAVQNSARVAKFHFPV